MKKLILTIVAMIVSVVTFAQSYVYSVASDGYTNIRSANSTNSRIIGELPNGGGSALLMHTSGSWYKINYNGIIGYVHKSQVRLTGSGSAQSSASRKVYSVASDGYTNIRRAASTSSQIIGELVNGGSGATYISTSGNWYKVNYRGTVGYVHKSQVKLK